MATPSVQTPPVEKEFIKEKNEDKEKHGVYAMNDSNEPSIIEQMDKNYISETSKVDLGDVESIDPTNHIQMRKWLDDVYINLRKEPKTQAHRTRAPAHVKITDVLVPSDDDGHFLVRVYSPTSPSERESTEEFRPAVIVYHGGGWIHGYPQSDDGFSKFFASELQGVIFSVDYRLAPENHFPLPHNDCYAALEWVLKNHKSYRVDPKRVALWGCSAGANLAAGVALRDSFEHEKSRIRHVSLVVPVTCHPDRYPSHLLTASGSMEKFSPKVEGKDFRVQLRKLWDMYTNGESKNPYASMLHADLRPNHAPVHTTVAGCDGLRDEGIDYSLRLRNAGIDSQLEIIPGVPHGINLSPDTYAARQFFRNQARVLNTALNSDF